MHRHTHSKKPKEIPPPRKKARQTPTNKVEGEKRERNGGGGGGRAGNYKKKTEINTTKSNSEIGLSKSLKRPKGILSCRRIWKIWWPVASWLRRLPAPEAAARADAPCRRRQRPSLPLFRTFHGSRQLITQWKWTSWISSPFAGSFPNEDTTSLLFFSHSQIPWNRELVH